MNKSDSSLLRMRWLGLVVAGIAFLGYLLTLSPVFYPGASAQYTAQHLGLMPFPALANIVWGWVIRLVALLPLGPLDIRLNVFSALCAAGALYVFFNLVLDTRPAYRRNASEQRVPEKSVNLFSAAMATLYLAACIPFWMVATRAHPMSFDVLLGLIPFRLVQRASRAHHNGGYYLAAFVYGLSVTEYSTMMALGPLLALSMLVSLLRQGRFTVRVVLGLVGCLLLGLVPYFAAAWQYMQGPAYAWREFEGYGQVLKYIWLEQWATLTRSLPKVGWLTIGVLTFLPWLIAYAYQLAPRPVNSGARFGQALVHIMISVVLLAVMWDFPFSPWRTTRGQPMVIVPYVFAAMGMGFLTAFLIDLAGRTKRGRGPISPLGYVAGSLLLVIPVVAAIRHLPETSGKSGRLPMQYLGRVLDSLGSRDWLLTSGESDAELALLAHQRGLNIQIINPRASHIGAYQNYIASRFEDARLQGLARVSLVALLKDWLARPGVVERIGVMSTPDLWEAMGYQAVPEGLLYTGEAADAVRDPSGLVEQLDGMLKEQGEEMLAVTRSASPAPATPWNKHYVLELSRQANNLGVYCEDQQRADLAEGLYRSALRFNTNNVSALINLNALAARSKLPDQEALAKQLEEVVKEREGDFSLWSLSRLHGYVRTPEIYASRGWSWAMSGKPGMAVREIKRAIRSGGDTPAAQLALAQMYFAQEDDQASEETYRKLLAVNPDHAAALLGLTRLAARQGDYAEARRGLVRLRQLDVSPEALNLEEAIVESMAGDYKKAFKLLTELTKRQPDNQRAWITLALVASQLGETRASEEALAKLQGMRNLPPPLRLALAQMAVVRKDFELARRLLEDVLRAQPGHVGALNLMVRIHQMLGDRSQVERYLDRLITADPRHAYGNYLLGTIQYLREQYALAEASYRASLATERTPDALNALSYLLVLKGNLDEAETLVREALQQDDGLAVAWDTLANILIKRGRLAEAEEALQKAMALRPQDPSIRASLVRLYDAQNRSAEAAKLADELLLKTTELSPSDVQQLREILKRLRGSV